MSDSLNNKHVLSRGYWILFLNPPLKFELDTVEGRCWWVGSRCQNIWIIRVLYEFYFCSPWILATRLLFLNPPVKFHLIKLRDTTDWWVPDVRISKQYMCYLNFILFPVNASYMATLNLSLKFKHDKVYGRCWVVGPRCQTIWKRNMWSIGFIILFSCSPWLLHTWLLFSKPPVKYDKAEGRFWRVVPWCQHMSHFCKKYITQATFVLPPTRAAMARWAHNKFDPVIMTSLWGTLSFLLLEKRYLRSIEKSYRRYSYIQHVLPRNIYSLRLEI
jgi:hypothetical protein